MACSHCSSDAVSRDTSGRVDRNQYPVLITAFKCAPDSFIIEYFKQLMDLYDKPYPEEQGEKCTDQPRSG